MPSGSARKKRSRAKRKGKGTPKQASKPKASSKATGSGKNDDPISSVDDALGNLLEHPEEFASTSQENAERLKAVTKQLFDTAGKLSAPGPLKSLVVKDFDADQIWGELALRNKPLLSMVDNVLKDVATTEAPSSSSSSSSSDDDEEKEEKDEEEDDAQAHDDVMEQPMSDVDAEDEEVGDDDKAAGSDTPQVRDPSAPLADDNVFFSLDEMHKLMDEPLSSNDPVLAGALFDDDDTAAMKLTGGVSGQDDDQEPDMQDRAGGRVGDNEEEEDDEPEVQFGITPYTGSDDELGDDDDDDDANIMYEDFFGPRPKSTVPPSGGSGHSSSSSSSSSSSATGRRPDQNDDAADGKALEEEKADDAGDEDNNEDEDEEEEEELDFSKMSSYEREKAKKKKEIADLEKKIVSSRSWDQMGEVTSSQRPADSLLERPLEFEYIGSAPPPLTQEAVQEVEDIVRQRILNGNFDDVIRKMEPKEKPFKPRAQVSSEKSTVFLSEIYEKEYVAKAMAGMDEDPNASGSAAPSSSAALFASPLDDTAQLRQEIASDVADLFHALDSLTNFHFTPKPPTDEVEVRGDVAAVAMEEVIPMGVSTSAAASAAEVFKSKQAGMPTEQAERTQQERRARRRRKKNKYKAKRKARELEDLAVAAAHPNSAAARRVAARADAKSMADARNVKQLEVTDNTQYTRSKAVFAKIQDSVNASNAGKGSKKRKRKRKGNKGQGDASAGTGPAAHFKL